MTNSQKDIYKSPIIKLSIFENFNVNGYFISYSVSSIFIEACRFHNITCKSGEHTSLISFSNDKIEITETMFSFIKARWGIAFFYPSKTNFPNNVTFSLNLVTNSDLEEGGCLIGSRKDLKCQENNFSQCRSDNRNTFIAFDVCFEMSARFLQFENANSTAPLIEIYNDDRYSSNFLMHLLDSNIYNNKNQKAFFTAVLKGILKLDLKQCHFIKNSPCNFYHNSEIANLEVRFFDTNFDIAKEDIFEANFNAGTNGITFGNNFSYFFEMKNHGPIYNQNICSVRQKLGLSNMLFQSVLFMSLNSYLCCFPYSFFVTNNFTK